jgi:hypothetical protein
MTCTTFIIVLQTIKLTSTGVAGEEAPTVDDYDPFLPVLTDCLFWLIVFIHKTVPNKNGRRNDGKRERASRVRKI